MLRTVGKKNVDVIGKVFAKKHFMQVIYSNDNWGDHYTRFTNNRLVHDFYAVDC